MFDGRAARAVRDFCDDWEADYAQEVDRAIHDRLRTVLKHPTGNYERHIQVRQEGGHHDVDDSNIIYGPWLEGTGSRNFPKTRFKGYATFRKVAQALDRKAAPNARAKVRSYLWRMN
jgi:hypothetical protein